MQASASAEQGDEKLRVANRLLYPSAWARLSLMSSGDMVPVDGATPEVAVGAFDSVAAGTCENEVGE